MIEDYGPGNQAADGRPETKELFANLKKDLPALEELLAKCNEHWIYEDPVYRFYHQSFKVFGLQSATVKVASVLRKENYDRGRPDLAPGAWRFINQ